jgi:hypothetical protein
VLLLVLAHGHVRRLVSKNVGGLQHGIVEQANGDVLRILAGGFVLELRHALEPAHARDTVEDPAQLRMRQHGGLRKDDRLRRIDARRQIGDAISRVWPASNFGSCGTVMAWRSTTQKMHGIFSCMATNFTSAPR